MEGKDPISVNANVKYPSQEIYKRLKVLAAEQDIPMGDLIGEMVEYVLEDQNRLNEVLARIKQSNGSR